MNKVLVLGAGMVTKPMIDYFIEKCGYEVTIATRTVSKAERIINDRTGGKAVEWTPDQHGLLENLVKEADLVVSMLPPTMHIPVAEICLEHKTNMVTTSYINPEMAALDERAKEQGIIILNEIGEDPGIDHMGVKKIIDQVKREGGQVVSINSYGAGLPSFEHNRNPFGYKFSWSPKGVIMAAKTPAAYLKNGKKVDVPAENLFDQHWLVDIEGVGTFETYPNRDSTRYVSYFGLDKNVSLYRGLLRFIGWCNTLKALKNMNLLDDDEEKDFRNTTYREFTSSLIGDDASGDIAYRCEKFLKVEANADIIKRLRWLGLFDDEQIYRERGTNADLLVDLMIRKMSYEPHEKDMIIVHDEVVARFEDGDERRTSTLVVEGIPGGDSAMARAVSLPAAIASRYILEEKIKAKGVHMPVLSEIYVPVLNELENLGLKFEHRKIPM